jgi:hypothetical protein
MWNFVHPWWQGTMAAAMGNSVAVPQKTKTELPHDLAIPLPVIYQKQLS